MFRDGMNSAFTNGIMITKHEAAATIATVFVAAVDKWVVCAAATAYWLYRLYLLHKNRNKKD